MTCTMAASAATVSQSGRVGATDEGSARRMELSGQLVNTKDGDDAKYGIIRGEPRVLATRIFGGTTGNYVDQADYNYYFRQGFRRGYDDGYNSQSRYGSVSNGTPTILGSLVSSILGLHSIR